MTDQHPLTDEICDGLVPFYLESEHDYTEMRAAADWQLEQVIEWLESNTTDYMGSGYDMTHFIPNSFLDDLKKAMRPTTQEDN